MQPLRGWSARIGDNLAASSWRVPLSRSGFHRSRSIRQRHDPARMLLQVARGSEDSGRSRRVRRRPRLDPVRHRSKSRRSDSIFTSATHHQCDRHGEEPFLQTASTMIERHAAPSTSGTSSRISETSSVRERGSVGRLLGANDTPISRLPRAPSTRLAGRPRHRVPSATLETTLRLGATGVPRETISKRALRISLPHPSTDWSLVFTAGDGHTAVLTDSFPTDSWRRGQSTRSSWQ